MRVDPVYVGVLVALLVTTGAGAVALPGEQVAAPPSPPADDDMRVAADGTRYTVHPGELRQGCPAGMDCIPSIDDPRFTPADRAGWLEPADLVIGVEVDGVARAYPLRILNAHEIVNDEVAGRPIAVTYCPLCRSGLVFDRTVQGSTLTFGVSGELLHANLVLYDRQTETYWSQLEGAAVVGPLVPTRLDVVPSALTTWEEWRAGHPDTAVLSRDTGIYPPEVYGSNPYAGYARSDRVGFGVGEVDDRLEPKAIVYGVTVGNASRAYPASLIEERGLLQDVVGGVPVLLVQDPADGGVAVFVRSTPNGTVDLHLEDGKLADDRGNRWSFDGRALEGPAAGTELRRLDTHGFYWFAWSSFRPETTVYSAG